MDSSCRQIAIDYLHIDGDHHYEGVRLDFDLFAPLVHDDGVITLHDSGNSASRAACRTR